MTHSLRHRYGRAYNPWPRARERAFTIEIRWAGHPAEYEAVHAKTEDGASKAAMHAGMRAAARTHRGKPDTIIIHDDAGTKAQHMNEIRGILRGQR